MMAWGTALINCIADAKLKVIIVLIDRVRLQKYTESTRMKFMELFKAKLLMQNKSRNTTWDIWLENV